MMDRITSGQELAGHTVAFTGRLASMSRPAAAEMVARHGGTFASTVTRQTTVLVIGRERWPLEPDGRVTRKLARARQLCWRKQTLEILPEERFLHWLGLTPQENQVCGQYTLGELAGLLDVPRRRLEAWQQRGFISAVAARDGLAVFDFRQVAAARSVQRLLAAGVTPRRLLRSLRQIRSWLDDDLDRLLSGVFIENEKCLYRTEAGSLVEASGQQLFEFGEQARAVSVPWSAAIPQDSLFDEAVRLEQSGELQAAAQQYRRLLIDEGPDADVAFNLANVLAELGEIPAAIERLQEAVTTDPDHFDAWNNLGNLLASENRLDEACRAYRRAVSIEPEYIDAHYGLADVLEQLGYREDARVHWRAYLNQEQKGEWADYARSRLSSVG